MAVEAAINSGYRCEHWLRASCISTMIERIHLEGGRRGPPHSLKSCFYKWYMSCVAEVCHNRERKKKEETLAVGD